MRFEQVLKDKGFLVYTVTGTSMLPFLRPRRDIVEIRPKGPGRCRKYDVVLYRAGGSYILHRILRVRRDDYVIAGDNCVTLEKGIRDRDILGVVARVVRDGRDIRPGERRYRLYQTLWCGCFPVRAALLRIRAALGRALRRLRHRARGGAE